MATSPAHIVIAPVILKRWRGTAHGDHACPNSSQQEGAANELALRGRTGSPRDQEVEKERRRQAGRSETMGDDIEHSGLRTVSHDLAVQRRCP